MTQDKCPKCGAGMSAHPDMYACGAIVCLPGSAATYECLERQLAAKQAEIDRLNGVVGKLHLTAVWLQDGVDDAWLWQVPAGESGANAELILAKWKEWQVEEQSGWPADAVLAWYKAKWIKGDSESPGYYEFELVRYENDEQMDAAEAAKEAGE